MKVAINLGLILETLNEEQLASRWTVQVGVKKNQDPNSEKCKEKKFWFGWLCV